MNEVYIAVRRSDDPNEELQHYGVVGMKWGVRRASYKSRANSKLSVKALNYDKKAANLMRKSEKIHANEDLERSNRIAIKANRYNAKAATLSKKAAKTDDGIKKLALERKSENLKYKAAKYKVKANQISKSSGYGYKAMRYSIKSDKVAMKAAKARKAIANNKSYMAMMDRKVSSLSEAELSGAYAFLNEYNR